MINKEMQSHISLIDLNFDASQWCPFIDQITAGCKKLQLLSR